MASASSTATSFLDNYLDVLKPLPTEFYRNLALMQKLDSLGEQTRQRMTELGEEILAPLRRSPDAQPNAETLLELRRIQRAAHSLQVEKVALNQENEIMVRNFIQRLNEDMGKFEKEFPNGPPADEPEESRASSLLPGGGMGKGAKVGKGAKGVAARFSKGAGGAFRNKSLLEEEEEDEFEDIDDGAEPESDQEPICYCKSASFGEMVACDNEDCEIEWFHFACVGLKRKPTGRWFCPDCTKK